MICYDLSLIKEWIIQLPLVIKIFGIIFLVLFILWLNDKIGKGI